MTVLEFVQLEQKHLQQFLEHVLENPEEYPNPDTMSEADWIEQYITYLDNIGE